MSIHSVSRVLRTAVGILLVAACYDDPLAVDLPLQEGVAADDDAAGSASSRHGEQIVISDNFLPRLALDLSAASTPRPNAPISITLSATANEPISGGTVRVTLPTLASMDHAGDGKRPSYPAGQFPIKSSWSLSAMRAGDTWRHTVSLGSVERGYYEVAVEIDTEGAERGPYVVNDTYRQAWILVDDTGGRMTPVFDESVFADGVAPVPGRFRSKKPPSSTSASDQGQASHDGDDVFYVKLMYVFNNYNTWAYGARAHANTISDEDPEDTNYLRQESRTVYNGVVTFTCPGVGQMIVGTADLPGTYEVDGGPFNSYWDAYPSDCGDTIQVTGTWYTYKPWQHLKEVIPRVDGGLGHSRSRISWRSLTSGTRSDYDPTTDRITFRGDGRSAKWTAAHEYTHALHEESLGGLWPTGAECQTHTLDTPSNYRCALSEGIADYGGNVGAPLGYNFESPHWAGSNETPAEFEGHVAGVFHDLLDSAADGNDQTYYD